MNKLQWRKVFHQIDTEDTSLLEISDERLIYLFQDFKILLSIYPGGMQLHIFKKMNKEPDFTLLNQLNTSTPIGTHCIDGGESNRIYSYRITLPVNMASPAAQGKEIALSKDTLKDIREKVFFAQRAAEGGYKILTQSYFAKNLHRELIRFREDLFLENM